MNAATRRRLLDMWEKIVEHWENREPGSVGPDGLCLSICWACLTDYSLVPAIAHDTIALFEPPPEDRWDYMLWFPPRECCEERATIAAFCWALTEAGDIDEADATITSVSADAVSANGLQNMIRGAFDANSGDILAQTEAGDVE